MKNSELRSHLADIYGNDIVIFENPAFDGSIIGMSYDNRVVYDFQKMVEEFALENNISDIEAMEFIEYNTLGSLSGNNNFPIVIYPIIDF